MPLPLVLLAGEEKHLRVRTVLGLLGVPRNHLCRPALRVAGVSTDSPQLLAAKALLDAAKSQGFSFQRIAHGEDGPLLGRRETVEYRDEIYLARYLNPAEPPVEGNTPQTLPRGEHGGGVIMKTVMTSPSTEILSRGRQKLIHRGRRGIWTRNTF